MKIRINISGRVDEVDTTKDKEKVFETLKARYLKLSPTKVRVIVDDAYKRALTIKAKTDKARQDLNVTVQKTEVKTAEKK